jgi:hypothetical protein
VADAVGEAFAAAGDVVTDGKIKLRVDTHIYAYPDHYHEDADAQAMYDRVMEIMKDLQDPTEDEWNELRLQMLAEVEKKQREKGRDG